ncbi:MAG: HTH-type transcriptional repressor KstR2 [Bacteroidetes bacterium ADurb.BinA395]|nr:TetR/AcrR family transcriptional regulator [Paludibacteraceae bacterium]OPZ01449.1 MAG: HTH-type transcriptional repressor KstR2 [Bacteroidetes bacterium ADurb.BinA395]HOF98665.1 TetR/AcrR family transcriptional regulator [Paludibacteraceae bacterium]HOR39902.1 TetR/AcrR family transcriptional regulator [Paludibacteraceae bacterium]HPL76517.1 TetR/AcrR family transcriptional regulator [Paludibacteraceae bacterium]
MPEKTSRTKKLLIEVARKLFAERGKKNVTMNDIAETSGKGRRTLYTYFKNKDEIYKAVIDSELIKIFQEIQSVSLEKIEPDIKLTKHIHKHLDAIKETVNRNGSLKADFFRDIYEVERTRRKIDIQEIELIKSILREGIEKKLFKRMNVELSSIIILYALKGLEVPYIRENMGIEFEKNKNSIVDFVLAGIKLPTSKEMI